ncbi:alpha/beta hydrolase-like protein [Calycina marina]|uniref:Alpha/beta hydrolase-like protein n=1 Tax=Calycina marina TaxID=1763456 RepID=A0A9P8CCA5_9HELO|nr:alpha/beta hydrolase-like protein [Calycina marina]
MKFSTQILALLGAITCALASVVRSSDSANGLDFVYPYPVKSYRFVSQRKHFTMSYMDVMPEGTPKGSIVLLHGKNFCGATWNATIQVLVDDGYRVVAPDQVGFCKSTKPSEYQFSLMALAQNTNGLLNSIGITNATIMGHSMGGMISARYALMYPNETYQLVMVDPLGLENWFSLGVPYQSPDLSYSSELETTYDSLKTYQQSTYYAGTWLSSYDVWVNMLLSIYQGPLGDRFAWNMAETTDMIFTQPVIDELPNLQMSSLLMVGDKDTTAIGSKWAPADIKALIGHYEVLGKEVSAEIPGCTLVEFPLLGHAPQIQDPDTFHAALLNWLP